MDRGKRLRQSENGRAPVQDMQNRIHAPIKRTLGATEEAVAFTRFEGLRMNRAGELASLAVVLEDVLHDVYAKMPRPKLKALLMTPQFTTEQRTYWFYVFNLRGE